MAKPLKNVEEVAAEIPMTFEELMATFSDAELAESRDASGQTANAGYDRIPTLKINYCTLADKSGRTIKEGNWVILQNNGKLEVEVEDEDGDKSTEIRIEDMGVDLGKNPKITIYCVGSMYSFYPDSKGAKEDICRSQLVFDPKREKHVGNNLPYECRGGKCPRRSATCTKEEKCGCQWVIFCEVTLPDGEKIKALMYAKGSSYIPFSDYIKSLGTMPIYFAPTKLSTKQELSQQGKPYYVMGFLFQKDKPFPTLEARSNIETARSTREAAVENNAGHKNAMLENKSTAGTPSQLVDKSAGKSSTPVTVIEDDDDISF